MGNGEAWDALVESLRSAPPARTDPLSVEDSLLFIWSEFGVTERSSPAAYGDALKAAYGRVRAAGPGDELGLLQEAVRVVRAHFAAQAAAPGYEAYRLRGAILLALIDVIREHGPVTNELILLARDEVFDAVRKVQGRG